MKVYFAARFSRLPELLDHKHEIESIANARGSEITITSRWLLGGHEWVGTPDEDIPHVHQAEFARIDIDDLMSADVVVCFTDPTRTGPARGGRHVEMGFALAKNMPILCIGHRENVFYCLPEIDFVPTWDEARAWLIARAECIEGVAA